MVGDAGRKREEREDTRCRKQAERRKWVESVRKRGGPYGRQNNETIGMMLDCCGRDQAQALAGSLAGRIPARKTLQHRRKKGAASGKREGPRNSTAAAPLGFLPRLLYLLLSSLTAILSLSSFFFLSFFFLFSFYHPCRL